MSFPRRSFLLTVPAALMLAACGESTSTSVAGGAAAMPKEQPVSIEAVKKYAKGFDVGQAMSQRQLFVFFDPKCPHCALLWRETRAMHNMARFTWIPVMLLRGSGAAQGAHFLSAADPVAAMDEHANDVLAGRMGVSASSDVPAELEAAIKQNTQLLESFQATGVPFLVAKNVQTGAVFSRSGGMPAEALAAQLGWA